jgi:D-glycero-D-manno-heptose 1,7-bisphosphate phosphatase
MRRAAFLDRDGTIVVERYYLADPARVELVPGAAGALAALADAGYALVIITNQSGIARGLYSEADFEAVQARLTELLADAGVTLNGVYHCPHHPDFTGPCECRKPGVGLYVQAAQELGLDLRHSLYIGDRVKDVLPARVLGGTGVLVRTGYGATEASDAPRGTLVVADLTELIAMLPEIAAREAKTGQPTGPEPAPSAIDTTGELS